MGEWEWEIESTPVPGDDSIMPGANHHQVGSNNNNLGESNMIKEKVIKNPYLLGEEVRVAKWK